MKKKNRNWFPVRFWIFNFLCKKKSIFFYENSVFLKKHHYGFVCCFFFLILLRLCEFTSYPKKWIDPSGLTLLLLLFVGIFVCVCVCVYCILPWKAFIIIKHNNNNRMNWLIKLIRRRKRRQKFCRQMSSVFFLMYMIWPMTFKKIIFEAANVFVCLFVRLWWKRIHK